MSDLDDFRALFLQEYERLCLFAVRSGVGRSEAEEVVQDVFVRLWDTPSALLRAVSPSAYLHGAVRHALLNRLRHARTTLRAHEQARADRRSPGVSMDVGRAPDVLVERQSLAEAVRAAIADLPDRGREALLLQRESGLSYAEISGVMQVSQSTVKTHIARALDALRQRLAPWYEGGASVAVSAREKLVSADSTGGGPVLRAPPSADSSRHARQRSQRS
jgi:RNA polymerase sigma-70 factor (family 1)